MANVRQLDKYELLKLKATVLYILNKCKDKKIDYIHLFKILYFADREHYAKYGRRIIKDTFCALDCGPVPSQLYDIIKFWGNQKKSIGNPLLSSIFRNTLSNTPEVNEEGKPVYILRPLEAPDMDELSVSDIELLDKSIDENKDKGFKNISDDSHGDAWKTARNKKINSEMDTVLMAKEAGASDGMLEYIKENEEIDACLAQD